MNQSQSKYLKHIIANPVFNGGGIVKKIMIFFAAMSLICLALIVTLGVLAFNFVSSASVNLKDMDLQTFESVIANKTVELDSLQQEKYRLLREELARPGLAEAERGAIKQNLFALLSSNQTAQIEAWRGQAVTKAREFAGLPSDMIDWLERFGLPVHEVISRLNSFMILFGLDASNKSG